MPRAKVLEKSAEVEALHDQIDERARNVTPEEKVQVKVESDDENGDDDE